MRCKKGLPEIEKTRFLTDCITVLKEDYGERNPSRWVVLSFIFNSGLSCLLISKNVSRTVKLYDEREGCYPPVFCFFTWFGFGLAWWGVIISKSVTDTFNKMLIIQQQTRTSTKSIAIAKATTPFTLWNENGQECDVSLKYNEVLWKKHPPKVKLTWLYAERQ